LDRIGKISSSYVVPRLCERPDGSLIISPLVRFGRESSSGPVTLPDVEPWAGEGPEPDPAVSRPRSLRPLIALVVVVWAVIVGLAVWA